MNANLKQIVGPGILEQEQTERTETRKAKSLCPASIEIGRPFIRVMSSFESVLCSLCYLLFKGIWLRSSLCALWVLLWQSALAEVHYVDVNSTNATPPYTNWATAATNIQDAVNAAVAGDEVVVTNGIYATGGRSVDGHVNNRVVVDKPLHVRSVNGPQSTTIDGGGSLRCVYLTSSASLSGFTLTDGGICCVGVYYAVGGGAYGGTLNNCILTKNGVEFAGGGAYGSTLNNCTLTGNFAGVFGGGAAGSTLNNCMLTGNNSYNYGGGTYGCTLNNCTLTGNSADPGSGGGTYGGTLNNCIVYFNTATDGANFSPSQSQDVTVLNYCCTTPQPTNGVGSITNAPLFVDTNGWSNLRLQPNSPCINAGNNSYVTTATDLDGNPRISGGTVDIGAYEFQWPQLTIAPSGTNVILTWPTNNAGYDYTGYTLQSTTNLGSPVWSTNSPAPVVIGGQNVIINPISGPQQFYRLKH